MHVAAGSIFLFRPDLELMGASIWSRALTAFLCRNVDPSTRLLHAYTPPPNQDGGAGTSLHGVLLLSQFLCTLMPAITATARKLPVVQLALDLRAPPCCVEQLPCGTLVVGDSSGGLTAVCMPTAAASRGSSENDGKVVRIQCDVELPCAHALCYLEGWGASGELKCSNTRKC